MVIQIIMEVLIVLIGTCGLIMHSGWLSGRPRKDFFRYYTNLSNLFVVMFYLIRLVVRITGNINGFFGKIVFSELWFYSVTMTIFLTFGIFHFVLVPQFKKAPSDSDEFRMLHSLSNYFVHYVVPLLSLLTWLIFADKTQLDYRWALIWPVIPWIYVIYSIIRGLRGDKFERTDSAYPYDFMDIGKHGWGIVIRNCLLVTVVFVLAGLFFIFLKKLI